VKIGVAELRIAASPASTDCSAQAISVKGMTLFRQAWRKNRRHVSRSRGRRTCRCRRTASRMPPAISVRAAIKVTGGTVSTPILMKV
jgi:hypothetical protein